MLVLAGVEFNDVTLTYRGEGMLHLIVRNFLNFWFYGKFCVQFIQNVTRPLTGRDFFIGCNMVSTNISIDPDRFSFMDPV